MSKASDIPLIPPPDAEELAYIVDKFGPLALSLSRSCKIPPSRFNDLCDALHTAECVFLEAVQSLGRVERLKRQENLTNELCHAARTMANCWPKLDSYIQTRVEREFSSALGDVLVSEKRIKVGGTFLASRQTLVSLGRIVAALKTASSDAPRCVVAKDGRTPRVLTSALLAAGLALHDYWTGPLRREFTSEGWDEVFDDPDNPNRGKLTPRDPAVVFFTRRSRPLRALKSCVRLPLGT